MGGGAYSYNAMGGHGHNVMGCLELPRGTPRAPGAPRHGWRGAQQGRPSAVPQAAKGHSEGRGAVNGQRGTGSGLRALASHGGPGPGLSRECMTLHCVRARAEPGVHDIALCKGQGCWGQQMQGHSHGGARGPIMQGVKGGHEHLAAAQQRTPGKHVYLEGYRAGVHCLQAPAGDALRSTIWRVSGAHRRHGQALHGLAEHPRAPGVAAAANPNPNSNPSPRVPWGAASGGLTSLNTDQNANVNAHANPGPNQRYP